MYKKICALMIMVSVASALHLKNIDRAKIEEGVSYKGGPSLSLPFPLASTVIFQDSSRNEYTFWTQMHDPIFWKKDTIVFSWRGWEVDGTGFIACAWSVDGGNTFTVARRINQIAGTFVAGGRYPSAFCAQGLPIAPHPELAPGPAWGYPTALTGDFSDPSIWYGSNDGNITAHKNNVAPLPDGRILCAITTQNYGFYYGIYDPLLGVYTTTPTQVDAGFGAYAIDYFGNAVYVFGWTGSAPGYYKYENGVWTGPFDLMSPPVLQLPNGEVLNSIMWMDGIVLNDGTPVMIMDLGDGAGLDSVEASRVIFLVTPTTYVQLVQPDIAPEAHYYYPQLSIDRETGVVYAVWEKVDAWWNDPTLGYGSWDIYATYSFDNGATWATPVNLTQTTGTNECLVQLAKRSFGGKLLFGYARATDNRDLYWNIQVPGTPVFARVYLAFSPKIGVEEKTVPSLTHINAYINGKILNILSSSSEKMNVSIYDVIGRKVFSKDILLNKGMNTLPLNGFSKGMYLIRLESENSKEVLKFVNF